MISPKAAIWLNIVYGFITALSEPSLEAAGVSHGDAMHVLAIAGFVGVALNLVLHAYSANVAGPAVK